MNADRDPPRLRASSGSPPDLARALEMARSDIPDSAAMSEIETSLAPFLTKSGRSNPVSVRPVAAGAAASFKFLLAAVVAAASVGGAVHYLRSAPKMNEPVALPAAASAPHESTERTAARRAEPAPTESPAPETSAPAPDEPSTPAVHASDRPNGVIAQKATAIAPSSSATSAAAFPEATGSAEVALLERAAHLLGSDPAGALALTQEHAREYPAGALTQEREFVAIEALRALGRTSEANARIDQFMARFPHSAHLRRLEQFRGATSDETP
jgi:hypothetical protein